MLHKMQSKMALATADQSRRFAKVDVRGAENGPRVSLSKRRQPLELLNAGPSESAKRYFRIDVQLGNAIRRRKLSGRVFAKTFAECRKLGIFDLEPSSSRMATMADKVFSASYQSGVQIEAGNTACGADARLCA
jgi:hypothetical protein